MVTAVIYDLDGTLIDSRGDLADSVNAMLAALGLPPRDERQICTFVGEGAERLVRRSLGTENEHRLPEAMKSWRAEYARRLLVRTRPYPGVAELLASPPPLRAVLTNKPGGFAREILQGLGLLGSLHKVIGGDEAPRKPDPTGLLRLCSDLGSDAARSLFVGDHPIDIATGAAAGVPVCAASWGFVEESELRRANPAHLCQSPAEVVRLLARLSRE